MRAQAPKGHLDGMLLAAPEDGPRHGYAVTEALRAGSGGRFGLPTGTIYPALRRLERAGLVRTPVDRARRAAPAPYELTPAGRRPLDAERDSWAEFSATVTALPVLPGVSCQPSWPARRITSSMG